MNVSGYLAKRWRGKISARELFWHDTVAKGSLVNVAAAFVTIALLAAEAPIWLVFTCHFSTLPYNLFLLGANLRHPSRTAIYSAGTIAWMAVATLL